MLGFPGWSCVSFQDILEAQGVLDFLCPCNTIPPGVTQHLGLTLGPHRYVRCKWELYERWRCTHLGYTLISTRATLGVVDREHFVPVLSEAHFAFQPASPSPRSPSRPCVLPSACVLGGTQAHFDGSLSKTQLGKPRAKHTSAPVFALISLGHQEFALNVKNATERALLEPWPATQPTRPPGRKPSTLTAHRWFGDNRFPGDCQRLRGVCRERA